MDVPAHHQPQRHDRRMLRDIGTGDHARQKVMENEPLQHHDEEGEGAEGSGRGMTVEEAKQRIDQQRAFDEEVLRRQRQRRREVVRWWALGLGLALASVLVAGAVASGEGWWWAWWPQEWWWVWVLVALGSIVMAVAGIAALVAVVGAAMALRLAKGVLSWYLYLVTTLFIKPVLRGLRHVPGLERALNNLLRAVFLVWLYGLVVFERNLRWVLQHFVGHHKETGRPYSLVNCLDTRFEGAFSVWPTTEEMTRQTEMEAQQQREAMKDQNEYVFGDEEYSHAKAYSLGIAAKLAYENTAIIRCEVAKWGFTTCQVYRYKYTKAYLATNEHMALLVFCGTHPLNLKNLITDIQASLIPADGLGHVHAGFLSALGINPIELEAEAKAAQLQAELENETVTVLLPSRRSLFYRLKTRIIGTLIRWTVALFSWNRKLVLRLTGLAEYQEKVEASSKKAPAYDQIIANLRELGLLEHDRRIQLSRYEKKRPRRKLWITGHSLGGALATLFVAKMMLDFPDSEDNIGGVYTFGQPRLGDVHFAQFLTDRIGDRLYRFVNRNDVIPRLPLGIPYWLVKRLLKMTKKESEEVPDVNSIRNNLLCFVTGVASKGTSYKHAGILKYIDPAGRIVESAQLYHILYLQLVGLTSISVIRNLHRESWLRIVMRFVLPFFMNDHLVCDYVNAVADARDKERLEKGRA